MISVVITTYGGGKQLRRAVESVLSQTYIDVELIVVDDNNPNTDARCKTEAIMAEYALNKRVKYIKHERNKNGAAARNTGISYAKGEYIAFLDDDDYYMHDRFEQFMKIAAADKTIDGICSGVIFMRFGNVVNYMKPSKKQPQMQDLFTDQSILGTGSNLFIKASAVRDVGGFDEAFQRFQDVEFMIRIAQKYKIVFTEQMLVIKDNSNGKKPSYPKVRKALDVFSDKFRNEIESLSDRDKQLFLDDRITYLFSLAAANGNQSDMRLEYENIKKLRTPTEKENNIYNHYKRNRLIMRLKSNIVLHNALSRIKNTYKDKKLRKQFADIAEIDRNYYYNKK